jgi:hypothetical protein
MNKGLRIYLKNAFIHPAAAAEFAKTGVAVHPYVAGEN